MLKNKVSRQFKKTEKGMAFVESIPVLFMVVVVFNFSLGFFGAIHSGILNSIASYNYTMETFRFRSNLMYFRPGDTKMANYAASMARVHGVTTDGSVDDDSADGRKNKWPATVRSIAFTQSVTKIQDPLLGQSPDSVNRGYKTNNETNSGSTWFVGSKYLADGNNYVKSPEIWVKTVYGICLNAECKK
jgi:hypothetical protein